MTNCTTEHCLTEDGKSQFPISIFVERQLPSWVVADHPKFQLFLEAYYEWLEGDGQAYAAKYCLKDNLDVDKSVDDFLEFFKREYLHNIPRDLYHIDKCETVSIGTVEGQSVYNIDVVVGENSDIYIRYTERTEKFNDGVTRSIITLLTTLPELSGTTVSVLSNINGILVPINENLIGDYSIVGNVITFSPTYNSNTGQTLLNETITVHITNMDVEIPLEEYSLGTVTNHCNSTRPLIFSGDVIGNDGFASSDGNSSISSVISIDVCDNIQVNERLLIKTIKELNIKKGTEASYRFLFNILFNEDIEITYPNKNLLKASDGKWQRGADINVSSSLTVGTDGIERDFELGIKFNIDTSNPRLTFRPNDQSTLIGEWNATSNSPTLADGTGTNGHTYTVSVGGKIDLGSGEDMLYIEGDSVVYSASAGKWIRVGVHDFSVKEKLIDSYMTNVLHIDSQIPIANGDKFTLTYSKRKISGSYQNEDGKLSSTMLLQDGYKYQQFSYIIRSEQTVDKYADYVKRLLHPAGLIMFGEIMLQECIGWLVQHAEYYIDLPPKQITSENVYDVNSQTPQLGPRWRSFDLSKFQYGLSSDLMNNTQIGNFGNQVIGEIIDEQEKSIDYLLDADLELRGNINAGLALRGRFEYDLENASNTPATDPEYYRTGDPVMVYPKVSTTYDFPISRYAMVQQNLYTNFADESVTVGAGDITNGYIQFGVSSNGSADSVNMALPHNDTGAAGDAITVTPTPSRTVDIDYVVDKATNRITFPVGSSVIAGDIFQIEQNRYMVLPTDFYGDARIELFHSREITQEEIYTYTAIGGETEYIFLDDEELTLKTIYNTFQLSMVVYDPSPINLYPFTDYNAEYIDGQGLKITFVNMALVATDILSAEFTNEYYIFKDKELFDETVSGESDFDRSGNIIDFVVGTANATTTEEHEVTDSAILSSGVDLNGYPFVPEQSNDIDGFDILGANSIKVYKNNVLEPAGWSIDEINRKINLDPLTGFNIDFDIRVAILASGGDIYIGGDWTDSAAVSSDSIARYSGGILYPLGDGLDGVILAIAEDNSGNIYAGGYFKIPPSTDYAYLAKWDGVSWELVHPTKIPNGSVTCIVADASDNLYIGGAFTHIGNTYSRGIAMFDGVDFTFPLGQNLQRSGLAGRFNHYAIDVPEKFSITTECFCAANDSVESSIIGFDSRYTQAYGNYFDSGISEYVSIPINSIARWNANTKMLDDIGGGIPGFGRVTSICVSGNDDIYAVYSPLSGNDFIYKWDGVVWVSIGEIFGRAYSIIFDDVNSVLYVGGTFSNVDNITGTSNIAQYQLGVWSPVGFSGINNGQVNSIGKTSLGEIYIGGIFDEIETSLGVYLPNTNNIVKWDGMSYDNLSGGLITFGGGIANVSGIVVDSLDVVYVAGTFNRQNITVVSNVIKYDGVSWVKTDSMGLVWNGASWISVGGMYPVKSIIIDQQGTPVCLTTTNIMFKLNKVPTEKWTHVSSTLPYAIDGLNFVHFGHFGVLYAGGTISKVGPTATNYAPVVNIVRLPFTTRVYDIQEDSGNFIIGGAFDGAYAPDGSIDYITSGDIVVWDTNTNTLSGFFPQTMSPAFAQVAGYNREVTCFNKYDSQHVFIAGALQLHGNHAIYTIPDESFSKIKIGSDNVNILNIVYSMYYDTASEYMYLGGLFQNIRQMSAIPVIIPAGYIFRVAKNLNNWDSVDTMNYSTTNRLNGRVNSIIQTTPTEIVAGGQFSGKLSSWDTADPIWRSFTSTIGWSVGDILKIEYPRLKEGDNLLIKYYGSTGYLPNLVQDWVVPEDFSGQHIYYQGKVIVSGFPDGVDVLDPTIGYSDLQNMAFNNLTYIPDSLVYVLNIERGDQMESVVVDYTPINVIHANITDIYPV